MGLTFVTPLLYALFDVPLVVGVVMVGVGYGASLIILREVTRGALLAVVVTATFGANIPLTDRAVFGVVGDLGAEIHLVYFPLVVITVATVTRNRLREAGMPMPGKLLGVFVLWILIAGLAIDPARPDAVVFGALFYLCALISFEKVRRVVANELLYGRSVIMTLCLAGIGHTIIGLVQFVTQSGFGYTQLGEGSPVVTATIGLGPMSGLAIGTYVSGFARWELGTVLVLVVCVLVGWSLQARRSRALAAGLAAVLCATVVRLQGFDANRGGLLVGLATVVTVVLYTTIRRQGLPISNGPLRPSSLYAKFGRLLLFVVLVAITLYPSSVSGQQRSGPELSAGRVESLVEALGVISIPFFDASSLLPRLEQTVQGLLIVRPHVLTGIGAANWKYVPEVTMRLHNAYLTLLVWTGLVGVVLYLCSLLLALRHGRALLRTVEDKLLYVGLIAGVVGFSASIFFRPFDRLTLLVPLWVVLGVLVGESQRIDRLSNGSWEHDD
ncbi:hypothetical protein [Haloarcula pelagica]|uniref:hypothetical protein n=1 Tax=Haloarcula pelagica TaxID=3033389 RepID=UPI0024C40777|nr:hypothetical protein [Halomicroarcula sp. YJ-61-S]